MFNLHEFRLTDFCTQFVLDLKFDKTIPVENSPPHLLQKNIRLQGNMLHPYTGKAHKVIVLQESFNAGMLRSFRNENIGIIMKASLNAIEFTTKQLTSFEDNQL